MSFLNGTADDLRYLVKTGAEKEKDCALMTQSFFCFLVRPTGFEPAAYGFEEKNRRAS